MSGSLDFDMSDLDDLFDAPTEPAKTTKTRKPKEKVEVLSEGTKAVLAGIAVMEESVATDDVFLDALTDVGFSVVDEMDDTFKLGVSMPPDSDIWELVTDVEDNVEYLTWVIYGKNGTGKTTLLSTVDGMLILAAEDGTLSIKDKAKGKAKKLKIDSFGKLESAYWMLKNGTFTGEGIEIKTKTGTFLVTHVGFDTIDKLSEVCMRQIVLGEKAKDPSVDMLKRTIKHWGDMNEKMKYWLQRFKELPIQRVWLCQEAGNSEDLDNDEFSIGPALNKGLKTYLLSEADVIARTYLARDTETGKTQFRMTAMPNEHFVTKDRTNKLTGVIGNPNLTKLHGLVFDIK